MKYTESHEWVDIDGNVATVGISNYAQKELGDIVYVELPSMEKELRGGEEAAVLESTKAAADIYSPVSGTIVAVNEQLNDQPELINTSPEQQGWIFKIQLSDPSEIDALIDQQSYEKQYQS